jgi:hypothetical protein
VELVMNCLRSRPMVPKLLVGEFTKAHPHRTGLR